MSEIFNEANDAPKRTSSKQGQLMWTFRQLNGMGPGGNQFYLFRYASKGNRVVKWFRDERSAKAEMKSLNAELSEAGNGAVLDYRTRLDAYRASAILEPYGVSLVEAAEAYVAARKRDENPVMVSVLCEAVRNVYKRKVADKEVRESSLEKLMQRLSLLSATFGNTNAKTLDGVEIKQFLADKEDWKTATKKGTFTDWSTIFKAAIQLRLIDKNPLEGLDNFKVKDKAPVKITPTDKVRDIISHAPERARAALILKFFTGIRTSEVCKLDWSAIKGESLLISADVSKTRRVRRIALKGLLSGVLEWLAPYVKESGRVYELDESTFNKDVAAAC
jgi:hypothetical protein